MTSVPGLLDTIEDVLARHHELDRDNCRSCVALAAVSSLRRHVEQHGERLPANTVCACLDETGSRQVEVVERCLRCHALMDSDLPAHVEQQEKALRQVLDALEALESWDEELGSKSIAQAIWSARDAARSAL